MKVKLSAKTQMYEAINDMWNSKTGKTYLNILLYPKREDVIHWPAMKTESHSRQKKKQQRKKLRISSY